jgi:hypothetical protein
MKKIIALVLILISNINCKAQIVVNTTETDYTILPNNCYLEDSNSYLNPYVGEWKYINGSTSLLIKLRKIINYNNGTYSEDLLIGEYQYIENGVEKINTLSNFDTNYPDQYYHNINGNFLKTNDNIPKCQDCGNLPRISLVYSDPIKDVAGNISIGIYDVEAVKVNISTVGLRYFTNTAGNIQSEDVGITIPDGWYILEKQ